MNKVMLLGRLVKDTELKQANETTICRFAIAVDRDGKKQEGKPEADFINCFAFGKTAEFVDKYIHDKGLRLFVEGSWRTGSYKNNDGKTVYTNECYTYGIIPIDWRPKSGETKQEEPKTDENGFMSIPEGTEDEGLPFN